MENRPYANVPNHMVGAILSTLFCCLPFGIVAIVNASRVSNLVAVGDVRGAEDASAKAMTWIKVSIALGIVGTIIGVLVQVLAIGAAVASGAAQ